ncbi:MAG: menaquinone biosynthesis decarboxylase, partial [Bacteroidota bacterium]
TALESAGELIRVKEFVSPRLEITEVADRMVKHGGKALLFENNGTEFPLLINALASDRRICMALGVNKLSDFEANMAGILAEFTSQKKGIIQKLKLLPALKDIASWFPRNSGKRGQCQEVVMDKPDLTKLPILTCWPHDGGPFITLPGVHTKDPVTGIRNLGMYRMQVFSQDMTGIHWHLHKGSANHFRRYQELKKIMPVTVTLGGDPAYIYTATAPLPENLDEYLLAGFLRMKKVKLVKCLTNDLEVPADVDFVIEGYVDPSEDLIIEGPFGDHTGFYSLADFFPRFHVTCITHRRNAIYPATIVGIPPQEDGWIGKATERIFLMPIKMTVAPEVSDMHLPVEGVFHNITLVSIHKQFPGQALKIMSSLWGAGQMMFNKIMGVFDDDANLLDYLAVGRIISANCDPVDDIHFMHGPVDILDHASSNYAYGSKMGIDATKKLIQEMSSSAAVSLNAVKDQKLQDGFTHESRVEVHLIKQTFPEIKNIRTDFLLQGISIVIISISKNRKNQIRETAAAIIENEWIKDVKFLLFTDDFINIDDSSQVVWIVANNLDPIRDCFHHEPKPGIKFPALCIDGSCKNSELDGFSRDWPNVIVMDDKTINDVDEKWIRLGVGAMIPSPSLGYKPLVSNNGAISSKSG